MATETVESKTSQLIKAREAHPDMTMKELADACGIPVMRAKRLLGKARDAAPDGRADARASLGTQFHLALCELLSQKDFQHIIHGVLKGIVTSHAFLEEFSARRPCIPPFMEDPSQLYPLGGCKVVSTVVGMLGSPYTEEAKFEQRKFNSKSLQGGYSVPREPNVVQNVLKMEVERAKELLRQRQDAGVTLTVSLTDVHAQENPREASHPSHKGHFAHAFNMVMTMSDQGRLETRIYSAHIDKDIKNWVKDHKMVVVDVDQFVDRMNQLEHAGRWNADVDQIWSDLFGVTRPMLQLKKWPIKTHIRVLQSVFDYNSLASSVALFRASAWSS